MHLTLILGPMKSGKSFDLISHFSPLQYTTSKFALYQPERNIRDTGIESRSGLFIQAKKIKSLQEILNEDLSLVGIDEIHMFEPSDARYIGELLSRGTDVIVSGLDTDYRGELFDMTKKLFELGPREVKYKRAVCNDCKNFTAVYTQIYTSGKPLMGGMPPVIPDDGTFTYEPLCRKCFVR